MDSMIKETLKTLSCNNGWSYGIFWSFNQRNSLLLSLKDAYYEDQMGDLVDRMRTQVHFLGRGLIGEAAFTKNHRWVCSSPCFERTGLFENLEDDSDFYWQFCMGIQAIVLVPVEPWGVVQLGSTQKVLESKDIIDQVKAAFQGLGEGHELGAPSSGSQFFNLGLSGELPCPVIENFQHCTDAEANCSFDISSQLYPSCFDTNSIFTESCVIENQIQTGFKSTVSPFEQLFLEFGNQTQRKNSDCSVLTSSWPQKDIWNTQSSTLLSNPTDFSSQTGSGLFTLDELFQERAGLFPLSSLDEHKSAINIFERLPTNYMQSSGTDALRSNGEGKFYSIDRLLNNSGEEFGSGKPQAWDVSMAAGLSGAVFESPKKFESKVGTTSNSLFSRLGLDQLLDASSCSLAKSSSSSAKRRKIDSYSWSHDSETRDVIELDSGTSIKDGGVCSTGGSSNMGSGDASSSKKQPEPGKKKKKAKPGTKPRPKDRQMIQDRLAELRGLIPNGEKMSIDRLLERTIRHLNFMNSLTEYTECLKQVDKAKTGNNIPSNDGGGVTWACEFADQSMVCPLIVEDLSIPGQMLIEILYEECGFFLEMIDIIRNFGLIILKGVMEVRETKIWAHFIVEAKGDRHGMMRHEIFSSLIQILQMNDQSPANSTNKQFTSATPVFTNYQSIVPVSVNSMCKSMIKIEENQHETERKRVASKA